MSAYHLNILADYWRETLPNIDSPFSNSGCHKYVFPSFEVEGYSWDEGYDQPHNFKWRDYCVSWYKYLGRGMSESRQLSYQEVQELLAECMKDIKNHKGEEPNMQTITGRVDYLNARATSFGQMYGLKINGVEYSTGKDNPTAKYGVNQGDVVSFSAEQNAKGYWNIKGPVSKTQAAAVAAEPMAGRLVPAKSYADADSAKQKSITRQASRNTAVAFLKLAQEAGVLPTAKNKGAGFDALRDILDKVTDEFYNDSLNPAAYEGTATDGAQAAAAADSNWTE